MNISCFKDKWKWYIMAMRWTCRHANLSSMGCKHTPDIQLLIKLTVSQSEHCNWLQYMPQPLTDNVQNGWAYWVNGLCKFLGYLHQGCVYTPQGRMRVKGTNINDMLSQLNHELQKLSEWLVSNKLTINLKKHITSFSLPLI